MATLGKSSRRGSVFRGRTPSPTAATRKNKVQLCVGQEARDAQGRSHQPAPATLAPAAPSAWGWEPTIFCCLPCSHVRTPKQIHTAWWVSAPLRRPHATFGKAQPSPAVRTAKAEKITASTLRSAELSPPLKQTSCHAAIQSLAPELGPSSPRLPTPAQPDLGLWHHFHTQLPAVKCFEGFNLRESSTDSLPSPMMFRQSLCLRRQVPLPWAAVGRSPPGHKPGMCEGQGARRHAWQGTMSMNRQPAHEVTAKQRRLGQAKKPPGPGPRSHSSCQGGQEGEEKSTLQRSVRVERTSERGGLLHRQQLTEVWKAWGGREPTTRVTAAPSRLGTKTDRKGVPLASVIGET